MKLHVITIFARLLLYTKLVQSKDKANIKSYSQWRKNKNSKDVVRNLNSNCQFLVGIDIQTDIRPGQTSWEIKQWNSEELVEKSKPYSKKKVDRSKLYRHGLCLPVGVYEFSLKDEAGDGIIEGEKRGWYKVQINDKLALEGTGKFSFVDKRKFGICTNDSHCNDGDACNIGACNKRTNQCRFEKLSCKSCGKVEFSLEHVTDKNPHHVSWNVLELGSKKVVLSGGPYHKEDTSTLFRHTECIEDSSYQFVFNHDHDPAAKGAYTVKINGEVVKESHKEKRSTASLFADDTIFCSKAADCDDGNSCTVDTCYGFIKKCSNEIVENFTPECRSFGSPTFVAFRVSAADSATTASESEMRKFIFGINSNDLNMKSVFRSCSLNRFKPQAFNGYTKTFKKITNGVASVSISSSVTGTPAEDVVRDVLASATTKYGDLQSQFDFVMLCLPPGTKVGSGTDWKGYATINGFVSVYNDVNCNYLSVQMHEIGHNLGLSHSNDEKNYGDESGFMGISYDLVGGPVKCFNGPKSWALGWFFDSHVVVDIQTVSLLPLDFYKLVGVVDYENRGSKLTIVRLINSKDAFDYYVTFNSATGVNAGTNEGQNQVLVTKAPSGFSYEDTVLAAKLSDGQETNLFETMADPNVILEIKASSIYLQASPPYASVLIRKVLSPDLSIYANALTSLCTIGDALGFCGDCGGKAEIAVTTNDFPEQLSWDVTNLNTKQVPMTSGYYQEEETDYDSSKCLPFGKYKFSLTFSEENPSINFDYSLKVGAVEIDSDSVNTATYLENIFTICKENTHCNDHDGCTIDTCNTDTSLCENVRLDDSSCTDCSWLSINITPDNFPDETKWGLYAWSSDEELTSTIWQDIGDLFLHGLFDNDKNEGTVILSGDPNAVFVHGYGRSKAPTKSGRSKAPTRTSARMNRSLAVSGKNPRDLQESENIVEKICLAHGSFFEFIITDSFGDGMCCSEGNGSFSLVLEDKVLLEGGAFGSLASLEFSLKSCSSNSDCNDNNACTSDVCHSVLSVCTHEVLPCHACGAEVKVEVGTDWTPLGLSWKVKKSDSDVVVLSGGNYQVSCAQFEAIQCLPYGTYDFSIIELVEIALNSPCPTQGYKLSVDDVVIKKADVFLHAQTTFTISQNPIGRATTSLIRSNHEIYGSNKNSIN